MKMYDLLKTDLRDGGGGFFYQDMEGLVKQKFGFIETKQRLSRTKLGDDVTKNLAREKTIVVRWVPREWNLGNNGHTQK